MMCKREGRRKQARILVADWDQANASAVAGILRTAGFSVASACDGKQAVAEAEAFQPDLLITEPYLGRLSGIQAATKIASIFPECKVLFLSGEASVADIAKSAPEELVYSYTAKPIHPLDLLNATAYLACAEWSTGDSEPTPTDENAQPSEHNRPQPGGFTPPSLNRCQDGETASLALSSSRHYFRSPLDPKREHADRHITKSTQHAPA
jgi:CheY-like chemotaxis protein